MAKKIKTKSINKSSGSTPANKIKLFTLLGWIILGVLVALTITTAILYAVKVKGTTIDFSKTSSEIEAALQEAYNKLRPYLIAFIICIGSTVFAAIILFGIQSMYSSTYIVQNTKQKA